MTLLVRVAQVSSFVYQFIKRLDLGHSLGGSGFKSINQISLVIVEKLDQCFDRLVGMIVMSHLVS
jgi:hypothetical protein